MAQVVVARFIESPEDFRSVVTLGSTPESLVLEFKSEIDGWQIPPGTPERDQRKRDAQKELCRDIAQFANTFGGCLLIGVTEGEGERHRIAAAIKPVTHVDKLKAWIEDANKNFLVPSTLAPDLRAINLDAGTVLSVNVPASRHAVALWDRGAGTIEYVHRTSHGKAYMNPDEVERHIMNGSRAARSALASAKKEAKDRSVVLAGGIWLSLGHGQELFPQPCEIELGGDPDDGGFTLKIKHGGVHEVRLPYGVIEEAWVDTHGHVNLLLSIRIVYMNRKGFSVEPLAVMGSRPGRR